jgi:hypothetical protein
MRRPIHFAIRLPGGSWKRDDLLRELLADERFVVTDEQTFPQVSVRKQGLALGAEDSGTAAAPIGKHHTSTVSDGTRRGRDWGAASAGDEASGLREKAMPSISTSSSGRQTSPTA